MTAINETIKQLSQYKREWLKGDLIAGLMVAAITIPVCMGYAQIAGLPPVYGLYAAIIPAIIYVFFASSRRVMFGTDAVIASMIGAGLAGAAVGTEHLPVLAALSSLMIGVILLVFGILRVGVIARYLSKPTMTGFIAGLAIIVMVSQLPKIMGLNISGEDTLTILVTIVSQLQLINWYELIIGTATITALIIVKRYYKTFPAALVAIILFTILSALFNWESHGVHVVGDVPAGIAEFGIPWVSWAEFTYLLSICFATAVVVFADTLLTARNFALRHKEELHDNKELRAIGTANIVGGFLGAMPGAGSASRSAVAESAGMHSQFAQIISAGLIAVTLIFFNGLLYHMPTAVLAAIVIVAVMDLLAVRMYKKLYVTRRREFWLTLATALAVVILGILPGVLISVALSLGDFFLRSAKPPQALLGKISHKKGFYDLSDESDVHAVPGIAIYRFGAPLFFANHDEFEHEIMKLTRHKDTKAIIVDAAAVTDIDTTAADTVRSVAEKLENKQIPLYFTGLIQPVRHQLEAYEITAISSVHVHKTIEGAIAAIRKEI